VHAIEPPSLFLYGQMNDDYADLGQDRAPVPGGAILESLISPQALRHSGPRLQAGMKSHAECCRQPQLSSP
jgi:hypothetical protein